MSFFGISIPVLRVAGGIIVSMSGWRMLTEPDATEQRRSEAPAYPRSIDVPPSRLAFYPLTMPLTTGPGTISVAISIGAGRPTGFHPALIAFFRRDTGGRAPARLLIYLLYRHSAPHRGLHRPHRHHHHRAAVGVPAVLHRHSGVLERRGRLLSALVIPASG